MSDIIRLLPESIANQIAAGEVVQRPSSAVKELLENALDAGATRIELIVKDAGKQLIQVVDNGSGMSETDARMAFERHATSKISKADDLYSIRTFGFRGEALASIAAVAQVEMRTRRAADEAGTLLRVEASELKEHSPIATAQGTSIAVKNLFYNVPARRNFLKSNPVEMNHIFDEFNRVALAHPEVAFVLKHNEEEVYNFLPEKLSHRIVSLFGKGYKEQLITCTEETDVLKVKGYIGKPEFAKKSRGEQFFFVNNRFIKSSYLHHAVMWSYDELIGDDSYPFYVLFLEIDPKRIDINVHPTKTEIKFDDERTIYAILRAAVKKAIATNNITPSIDYEMNVNFGMMEKMYTGSPEKEPLDKEFNSNAFKPSKINTGDWKNLYSGFENKDNMEKLKSAQDGEVLIESSKVNSGKFNKELLISENPNTFQLQNRYIVTQIKSGMVIVDQQAAHERILYEKFLQMLQNKFGASQQFLFPQTIELSMADFNLVMEMEEDIRSLGFVFSVFGKNTLVLNGVPADSGSGNEKDLFEKLIEQYKTYQAELKLERHESLARSLAKRSAIKAGHKLVTTEMNSLLDQLFACKMPNYAPEGNPTIIVLTMEKIAELFHKSV